MGAASQELTDRAKLLISERRYQEAVRACRRALLSKPGQVEIRLLLGEALLALERYDEVRVEMMALARKVPDRAPVHRLLGEAYLRDGRPKQAVEALKKALELDPYDEVAEELLTEAVDEKAPISTTIERWFADEAEPTIETESPAWTEESTPVPGATHPAGLVVEEPSIQIDPSLVEEALSARPKTAVATPRRMRSRKRTMLGAPAAKPKLSPAPPKDAPLPPPPRPGAPAPVTKSHFDVPHVPPPSAPPPPPPQSVAPPPLGDSPFAPPPAPFARPDSELTHAATPSARHRGEPEPQTEELDISELSSADFEVELMDGEPTRARSNEMPDVPAAIMPPLGAPYAGAAYVTQDIDEIEDDSPTAAFSSPIVESALDGEATRAHRPVSESFDPPTLDHYPAPEYKDTPYAEPGRDPVTFEKPLRGEATPAIPPERVSEPVPKKRRRGAKKSWLLPVIGGGAGLIVFLGLVAFGVSVYMSSEEKQEIRAAAASAGDSGVREEIEAVIAEIGESGDEELLALEARLLATLTLEHDQDHGDQVRQIVAALTADEAHTDSAVATALVALADGDPQAAERTLSGLTAQGEQISEAFRARGYAMAALGDWTAAQTAARAAVEARPSAARHIAFHAITQHRSGETTGALTLLSGVPDGAQQPAIRIARARILVDSGSDPARAVQEASALIDDLAGRATPPQLSWAHLIRAMHAAGEGQSERALTEARAAAEHAPRLDESFEMELVEVFLRAGAAEDANERLSHLPEVVVDRAGRALLSAEVALAVDDLDRAETALGEAGSGNRQNLLRARIYEARGQVDAARPLYQQAMRAHGPERRQAAIRLASIEMSAGNYDLVVTHLEPIHAEAVDDLELVPLLARAYLRRDRPDDARRVIDQALRRRPQAAELNAVHGGVLLYQGDAAGALAPLRTAAAARPEDAALHADLGRAAHVMGHDDEARTAWETTLEHDATNARALIGLGQLAYAANDLEAANTRLDAAATSGGEALAVAQLRGQLLVMRGAGGEGVDVMRPLSREHEDAVVWTSLADLYAQAERDREADRTYGHALGLDEDNIDALLGRSLVQTRRGNLSNARTAIDRAVSLAEAAGLSRQVAARVAVARGRLEFEDGDYDATVTLANEALSADAQLGSAHLLLATVAIERGSDPLEHLRRAAAGHAPPPEALGQLAPRLPTGAEACAVARRYILAAPRGYDAPDVRRAVQRCD